jgi:electron transfer flavoprotein alpha subunit
MVLVFAEHQNGQLKKAALEAATYGSKAAAMLSTDCAAVVIGAPENADQLGNYGVKTVYQINHEALHHFDTRLYTAAIAQLAHKIGAQLLVLSHSATGKSLLGSLSVALEAGSVSGVNSLPSVDGNFVVGKNVFSGKAQAKIAISTDIKVISLAGNSLQPETVGDATASVEAFAPDLPASRVKVIEQKTVQGIVPLPEASLVVSAGRGVKDPANWGIIEELATELGATTACSRPVADSGWRPHHEHVGQTGIAIRPNLYIAIGISGAIQHLAGVNNSKVIVVINKDAEAPFFKAADYGVVGDLFDVVPRLTSAIRKFKAGA